MLFYSSSVASSSIFLDRQLIFKTFMYSDSFINNVNVEFLFFFVINHQHFELQFSLLDEFSHMTRKIDRLFSSQSFVKFLDDIISSSHHHFRSFVRICMLQAQLQQFDVLFFRQQQMFSSFFLFFFFFHHHFVLIDRKNQIRELRDSSSESRINRYRMMIIIIVD